MNFSGTACCARVIAILALVFVLGACSVVQQAAGWNPLERLSKPATTDSSDAGIAPPRVSGAVTPENVDAANKSRMISGDRAGGRPIQTQSALAQGDVTLNFTETDIREVVRVILGELLKVTYTIDPSIKGSATIYTATPVNKDALPQILVSLLAQNGAQMIIREGIYNIVPANSGMPTLQGPGSGNSAETTEVVMLQYASAPQLAKVLSPFMTASSRVAAGPANNTLLVSGSATVRSSLVALIKSFDVDLLAGQSYAIFPVTESEPEKVALEIRGFVQASMSDANGPIYVMALERINAVLVVSREPIYLDRIARFIAQIDAVGDTTARRLHVYYIQNGTALDLANMLRRAFAPTGANTGSGDAGSLAPGLEPATVGASSQLSQSPDAPSPSASQTNGLLGSPSGSNQGLGSSSGSGRSFGSSSGRSSQTSSSNLSGGATQEQDTPQSAKGMRFIPDIKNNALLVFATPSEYKMIEATLRKIDILPLQVMVEATVAEVTLNDNLQYGTQYFFKSGNFATTLSNATNGAVNPEFPGFAFAFSGGGNAQIALSALKSITTVKVVSDPQLLVLNNESARLQVGDLVPITTQTAVSTTTAGAPIVNTVDYKETGVIIEVTPRVNSGGLVSLDILQEVSDVVRTSTSTINSPTIQQRKIKTRIVAQDGETIGLGGLIKDSSTVANDGIPWLTDIPVLGALFGTRTHLAGRTELLILLTPRVIRDQSTVRALTEDLRTKLGALGSIPTVRDPIEPPGPLRR